MERVYKWEKEMCEKDREQRGEHRELRAWEYLPFLGQNPQPL